MNNFCPCFYSELEPKAHFLKIGPLRFINVNNMVSYQCRFANFFCLDGASIKMQKYLV